MMGTKASADGAPPKVAKAKAAPKALPPATPGDVEGAAVELVAAVDLAEAPEQHGRNSAHLAAVSEALSYIMQHPHFIDVDKDLCWNKMSVSVSNARGYGCVYMA